jgi:Flp pilus assembly CpaE family ATPase
MQGLYNSINWENVRALVISDIERRAADSILNSMATELATDVKQVLSNKELREEVRSFVRKGIKSIGETTKRAAVLKTAAKGWRDLEHGKEITSDHPDAEELRNLVATL